MKITITIKNTILTDFNGNGVELTDKALQEFALELESEVNIMEIQTDSGKLFLTGAELEVVKDE